MYNVTVTKRAQKNAMTMPKAVQNKFKALPQSLKVSCPIQPLFWHYSKLGNETYHCHLTLNWVACWTCKDGSINIEVYYAGSREKAPY